TTTDYADFFRNHFSSIKDLIPGSQSDLLTNVNRVKDLLTAVNSQKGMLGPLVGEAQRGTLNGIGGLLRDVAGFGNKVGREGEGRFNQNKSAWNTLLDKVFNTSGLLKLLPLLTRASSTVPVISAVLAPLALLIARL
ncbi:unnamed protein product, partial [Mesorhabditis spiculigera]